MCNHVDILKETDGTGKIRLIQEIRTWLNDETRVVRGVAQCDTLVPVFRRVCSFGRLAVTLPLVGCVSGGC